jgi:hypothetical protein
MHITMTIDNQEIPAIIQKVLHVLDLHGNLLSVSSLTKNGFKIIFEPNNCQIINRMGQVVGKAYLHNNLYVLHIYPTPPEHEHISITRYALATIWELLKDCEGERACESYKCNKGARSCLLCKERIVLGFQVEDRTLAISLYCTGYKCVQSTTNTSVYKGKFTYCDALSDINYDAARTISNTPSRVVQS